MEMRLTTAFQKISKLKERVRRIQGGTSASKTYSILQLWILNGIYNNNKFKGINSIVSESMPHLKRGAMRDFFDILKSLDIYNVANHNKSNHTYKINDCMFEFFSADQEDKLRGARRNNLFINEANNVSIHVYDELEVRTKYGIWLDWNPVANFWGMVEEVLILTYRDNDMLDDNIKKSIEERKNNNFWWTVYGLGLVGSVEGVIYTNWEIIEDIPEDAKLLCSGLDFGFSNDPTAVVSIYQYNKELILKERMFKHGLTNKEIAEELSDFEIGILYCDSAEPKSIKELNNYSIRALPAKKGKDSVLFGIQKVQDFKLRPTKDSLNLIQGLRNYSWFKNKNGEYINKPNHAFSDMLDALRYGITMNFGSAGKYARPNSTNRNRINKLDNIKAW